MGCWPAALPLFSIVSAKQHADVRIGLKWDDTSREASGKGRDRAMHCLKCKGFMMVERHYTLMNRRLYARCLNCGFWIDLADLLRFFHKVIASSVRGTKVRETYTL